MSQRHNNGIGVLSGRELQFLNNPYPIELQTSLVVPPAVLIGIQLGTTYFSLTGRCRHGGGNRAALRTAL